MANAPPITLLHLSDLQFGPHHRFERADAPGGLLYRLREDLGRMRDEEGLQPDLVLLTGDLTEHGRRSQFTEVLSFAHGLLEVTGLGPRRIVMVPGNHDINWDLSEAYFAERLGNEEKPQRPYWPKLQHYADLLAKFYEGQPGLGFTEAEPWTLYEYPELKVVVAGLDSVIAESHRPEDHHGFLGEPQLDFFAGKLRPYKERGWLRIGAVHHDPMHPESEEGRQDAKDLKGRLLPYLNLVVHGHIHEEQLGWPDNTVPALGIGSAGVKAPERPPEVPNQYQWVRVFPDRVEYATRAYVPDQKRWVGCLRSDLVGKDWRLTKRVAFEGVGETFSGKDGAGKAPVEDLAAMVDAYRRHWAHAYRHEALFDLAKMGEDADVPAGLDLLHVFVPQSARYILPYVNSPRDAIYQSDESWPTLVQIGGAASSPLPIDDVVVSPAEPWLLVLGNPGAGKSALTRWIMLRLCTDGEMLGELPADLVPVRIEMRRFDLQHGQARAAGRSYDFFDYLDEIHRERHLSLHGAPLRRLADVGRLLYLFDGLDEVAEPHARREYAERIAGLKARYDARIIVTSRVVGIQVTLPLFRDARFRTYALQDFNEQQIDAFLVRWHRLAFPGAPDVSAARLERLRNALRESQPVRALCGSPLLLTLVALLNRGAELPRQRHRVYERAVELMADQWEANKGIPATTGARFDLSNKQRFLRQLAFEMLTKLPGGTGNSVRYGDLVEFAAGFCMREYGHKLEESRVAAEQLIRHLRERNYILTFLGGQAFGFVHKALLEYLAAVEIVARYRAHVWGLDDVGEVFKDNWDDFSWLETLILVGRMLEEERPEQVATILAGVLGDVNPFTAALPDFRFLLERFVAELRQAPLMPVQAFALSFRRLDLGSPSDWFYGATASYAESLPFALDKIREFARRGKDDRDRLNGATLLRSRHQPASEWRPVFEHLARSAKKGSARLFAAKQLLDERRIAQLALRAKSPKVRADAARALEQLRIYRALLAVGRPRRGVVSLDGTRAGLIEETPTGTRFTYDPSYLSSSNPLPLSATLALRPEPFEARGLHPFFENLLPEGWLLDRTCEKLGIDRTDAFGLLLATCADCAGAVEIVPEPPQGLPVP
jgi:HipA-like protein